MSRELIGFEDMALAPDISKIQRLIGYRPVLDPPPEILERVIGYESERGA